MPEGETGVGGLGAPVGGLVTKGLLGELGGVIGGVGGLLNGLPAFGAADTGPVAFPAGVGGLGGVGVGSGSGMHKQKPRHYTRTIILPYFLRGGEEENSSVAC
ncbi:MAG: hypothetical protein JNK33_06295 [Candidatus Doudnabacteria bacterium]|nr:hypothetical protein [Candidatus Doudnabacteria bacterium]